MARLAALWIKRARRGPMEPRESVRAVAGRGLDGSADFGNFRQVTLIAAERWREAEAELGLAVDPAARRANLLVEGVDLTASRGRVLRVGAVRVRLRGETRPCERMDEACPGLRRALSPDWRAGAWGEVLDDGELVVDDPVEWSTEGGA